MLSGLELDRFCVRAMAASYERVDFGAGAAQGIWDLLPGQDGLLCTWRGSDANFGDILTDLAAWPWYSARAGAWCHRGFLRAARQSWREIGPVLSAPNRPPRILAGHSLGAGVATIVAAFMCAAGAPPRALVTCGSPRAGFAALERMITAAGVEVRRHVNGIDVVPSVPMAGRLLLRFRHVGNAIDHRGLTGDGFKDHRIAEYEGAIEVAADAVAADAVAGAAEDMVDRLRFEVGG